MRTLPWDSIARISFSASFAGDARARHTRNCPTAHHASTTPWSVVEREHALFRPPERLTTPAHACRINGSPRKPGVQGHGVARAVSTRREQHRSPPQSPAHGEAPPQNKTHRLNPLSQHQHRMHAHKHPPPSRTAVAARTSELHVWQRPPCPCLIEHHVKSSRLQPRMKPQPREQREWGGGREGGDGRRQQKPPAAREGEKQAGAVRPSSQGQSTDRGGACPSAKYWPTPCGARLRPERVHAQGARLSPELEE